MRKERWTAGTLCALAGELEMAGDGQRDSFGRLMARAARAARAWARVKAERGKPKRAR